MQTIIAGSSINNQSFFKLPLIFIAIFFVIDFVGIQTIRFFMNNMSVDFLLKNSVYSFCALLRPLFLFFVTAVFCCQKYRLHSVIDSWRKVTLIAIVFALLYWAWGLLFNFFFRFFISRAYENNSMLGIVFQMPIFSLFIIIAFSILFIFILIFLFYLFSKKEVSSRAVFKLEGVAGSRAYSHIYSFLMLFLPLITILYALGSVLRAISMSFDFGYAFGYIEVITLLITLIFLFINYITFYFSTRNRFNRIEPTVKLGKLIVTVMMTYLFLLLSSVVIAGVLIIFARQYLMLGYYMMGSSMLTLTLFIVGVVVNFLLLCVVSRLSVKIMYS